MDRKQFRTPPPGTARGNPLPTKKMARAPATPAQIAQYQEGLASPPSVFTTAGVAVAPDIVRYFEERTKRRRIVKTTRTPSDQILDWVPIESQHPSGKIATPPSAPAASIRAIDPTITYA